MNGKRKRVEDEEGEIHDDDMGPTASQSCEESTSFSTEESDFDDDEKTEQSLEFKKILKTLSRAVPRKNALDLLHSTAASKKYFVLDPQKCYTETEE